MSNYSLDDILNNHWLANQAAYEAFIEAVKQNQKELAEKFGYKSWDELREEVKKGKK